MLECFIIYALYPSRNIKSQKFDFRLEIPEISFLFSLLITVNANLQSSFDVAPAVIYPDLQKVEYSNDLFNYFLGLWPLKHF